MHTAIFWFRNDLRVTDNPGLEAAARAGRTIPLYIIDDAEIERLSTSPNRLMFLLQSLEDTKSRLRALGADLVIRQGNPALVLAELVQSYTVDAVHYSIAYDPVTIARDQSIAHHLNTLSVDFVGYPGWLAIDSIAPILTKGGKVVNVFTPFWKQWATQPRRTLAKTPTTLTLPSDITIGEIPTLSSLTKATEASPHAQIGGETAALTQLNRFLDESIHTYHELHDDLGADGSSHLSAHLHHGTISTRYIEALLPEGEGAAAFHRQLAWRDFYQYILFHHPKTPDLELQPRYHGLPWSHDKTLLEAWQSGQTGFPIVDAAMRQLRAEGYMHNRARLIVGSFLTKDLGLDWRLGEAHFMRLLCDADTASNVGNWQWIASVGVDPAPVFRRLYNPTLQQTRFDPNGIYVRRYIPELRQVPLEYLSEPWKMSLEQQAKYSCKIGKDYPAPVVDHSIARKVALERYRATAVPKSTES